MSAYGPVTIFAMMPCGVSYQMLFRVGLTSNDGKAIWARCCATYIVPLPAVVNVIWFATTFVLLVIETLKTPGVFVWTK